MGRPKPKKVGIRTTIWIPGKHVDLWNKIENKSGFVQIAMSDAVGVMMWAIMKKGNPKEHHRAVDDLDIDDVLPEFNKKFPLDELTQRRQNKWHKHSPRNHDSLL
ncbi:hypothetical protein EKK58_09495 [Candidatus Dependentiae bacterium]|nr:MAG: hypothetical protein EKK58_09495 [Candidatus Dependentiae bacterium]